MLSAVVRRVWVRLGVSENPIRLRLTPGLMMRTWLCLLLGRSLQNKLLVIFCFCILRPLFTVL